MEPTDYSAMTTFYQPTHLFTSQDLNGRLIYSLLPPSCPAIDKYHQLTEKGKDEEAASIHRDYRLDSLKPNKILMSRVDKDRLVHTLRLVGIYEGLARCRNGNHDDFNTLRELTIIGYDAKGNPIYASNKYNSPLYLSGGGLDFLDFIQSNDHTELLDFLIPDRIYNSIRKVMSYDTVNP